MVCFLQNRQHSLRSFLQAEPFAVPFCMFTILKSRPKGLLLQNRQRPAFPGGRPPSIISAKELNCCVRDGNRCTLPAIVTGFIP